MSIRFTIGSPIEKPPTRKKNPCSKGNIGGNWGLLGINPRKIRQVLNAKVSTVVKTMLVKQHENGVFTYKGLAVCRFFAIILYLELYVLCMLNFFVGVIVFFLYGFKFNIQPAYRFAHYFLPISYIPDEIDGVHAIEQRYRNSEQQTNTKPCSSIG